MKRIIFTVTNDLTYDQRMQRICTSLAEGGFEVLLVGRKLRDSLPLSQQLFQQKRIRCFFIKGFLFYAEYDFMLFWWLLFQRMDAICAIDLDTILPCLFVSVFRNKKRVYDAHELFTEQKEILTRPFIHKVWLAVEMFTVRKFANGYTVSGSIADELKKRYGVDYAIVRNMPYKSSLEISTAVIKEKFIIYQGAVNEARGIENLLAAMTQVDVPLHIYGDGNIYPKVKGLIEKYQLKDKVILKGKISPQLLSEVTGGAYAGINLVEPIGLNQLYSLANKFFDYIQSGIPQLTMNFPEYKKINEEFEVALLIDTVEPVEIADKLKLLLNHSVIHGRLKKNCIRAREVLNWENEEKRLMTFYNNLFLF